MSDDIATRLRESWNDEYLCCLGCFGENYHETDCVTQNAADEIERLRAELAHAQTEIARLERLASNG